MITSDALQIVTQHLERTASDIRRNQQEETEREKRTNRFTQAFVTVLAVVALLNLYFVGNLAQEIQLMARNMNQATGQLQDMSDRMSGMRYHVASMGENVGMMPIVAQQMRSISGEMQYIEADLEDIRANMTAMTTHVGNLTTDVDTMRLLFRDVNGKFIVMRQNVRQIAGVLP